MELSESQLALNSVDDHRIFLHDGLALSTCRFVCHDQTSYCPLWCVVVAAAAAVVVVVMDVVAVVAVVVAVAKEVVLEMIERKLNYLLSQWLRLEDK